MPDVKIDKGITLDLLSNSEPAMSSTSDMPVIETKPDSIAAPETKETPETEGITTEESATPETTEDSSATPEQKKPARGVQKRIDELTREREEARRLADAERAEKLRLLSLLEKGGKTESPETPAEDLAPVKPNKADFTDPDAYDSAMDQYIEAKAEWIAKKEVKSSIEEQNRKTMEANMAAEQKAIRDRYLERASKAQEKYADFVEVAESPDVQISIPMAAAIINHEQGPEIAYHLGKHPEEAKRISSLSPPLQIMELGFIAASLNAPPASSPAAAKPIVSAAPKPITPLASGAGNIEKPIEEMSMDEYAAKRTAQLNKERRGLRH